MTQYAGVDHFSAGASRDLTLAPGDARTVVLQALRALDLQTTREQYSVIEAERGSKLGGLTMTRSRVPLGVRVDLTPKDTGTALAVRIDDRWPVASTRRGVVAVYADVFTEILTGLDTALARADPAAAAAFPLWWRVLPEHEIDASRARGESAARAERAVQKGTSRLLDGPRTGPSTALADARVDTVRFVTPVTTAQIPADTVDGMLTVGQLVASRPGGMPKNLVADVQSTVLVLEQRLAGLGRTPVPGGITIELDAAAVPVMTFLFQQASLREALPVRLLMRCTTCRLEKVVNPDLTRLRERNRRTRILQTSVGAVFGAHQISPFVLVGRLAGLKKSEPDFVCARCQGTDADERPITFCPTCGERLDASVLRSCPACSHDIRSLLTTKVVWHELDRAVAEVAEAPPAVAPVVAPVPPAVAPAQVGAWAPPAVPAVPAAAVPSTPVEWTAPPPPPAYAPARKQGSRFARTPAAPAPAPGWYPDPWRAGEQRWWDGRAWTAHLMSGGRAHQQGPPAG